jgi:hypothetical protein
MGHLNVCGVTYSVSCYGTQFYRLGRKGVLSTGNKGALLLSDYVFMEFTVKPRNGLSFTLMAEKKSRN